MSIHDPMDKAYLSLLEDSSSNPIEERNEATSYMAQVKILVNRANLGGSLVNGGS